MYIQNWIIIYHTSSCKLYPPHPDELIRFKGSCGKKNWLVSDDDSDEHTKLPLRPKHWTKGNTRMHLFDLVRSYSIDRMGLANAKQIVHCCSHQIIAKANLTDYIRINTQEW